MLQLTSRTQLSKIRRHAKKRGYRVLRDGCGNFTVITTQIEPPRPLLGLDHVPLWAIEQVIFTPLPDLSPRPKPQPRPIGFVRLTETATPVATTTAPAHAQAHHSFLALVKALWAKGGAS
jgi:hypothetical protein